MREYKKISKEAQKVMKQAYRDSWKRNLWRLWKTHCKKLKIIKDLSQNKITFETHLKLLNFFKDHNVLNAKIKELNENKFKVII